MGLFSKPTPEEKEAKILITRRMPITVRITFDTSARIAATANRLKPLPQSLVEI